jgi:N-acetylmuramoyl-L-alanine amidase CwlA
MATYTYSAFEKAVKNAGIPRVIFEDGWNDPKICPFGVSPSAGLVLHHTANGGAKGNAPSLYWCLNNTYAPVRAAHFLIGRDGTVHVLSGRGSYHAGAGRVEGGMKVGDTWIPSSSGNKYLVGIEIESKGTDPSTRAAESSVDGITRAQVKSTIKLTSAMIDLMGVGVDTVIRHADWAPRRKNDVLQPLSWWRRRIRRYRARQKIARLVTRK